MLYGSIRCTLDLPVISSGLKALSIQCTLVWEDLPVLWQPWSYRLQSDPNSVCRHTPVLTRCSYTLVTNSCDILLIHHHVLFCATSLPLPSTMAWRTAQPEEGPPVRFLRCLDLPVVAGHEGTPTTSSNQHAWWPDHMEMLAYYWPFEKGIHWSLVNSHNKQPVMWSFNFFFLLVLTSCWINSWHASDFMGHQVKGAMRFGTFKSIDFKKNWYVKVPVVLRSLML